MMKQQAQIDAIEKKLDLLLRAPKKHTKYDNMCYGCGSPDHMVRECPTRKSTNQKKRGGQSKPQESPSSMTQAGN